MTALHFTRFYNSHDITYGSIRMSRVQYVFRIPSITVVVSDIMDMFFISNITCSSHLPDVF
jgi:hypothetical protein